MRKFTKLFGISLCVCFLAGCHTYAYDDATYGFRFGTEVAVFTTAKSTGGQKAGSGIESDVLDKLLADKQAKLETAKLEEDSTPVAD